VVDILYAVVDWALKWCHLAQNTEYGWTSLDRKTGRVMREQQPLLKKLKLLVLFNPIMEWIDTFHVVRVHAHKKAINKGEEEGQSLSKRQIRPFIETYGIDMNDFEPSDPDEYANFKDLFIRHHKPGSRPIHEPGDLSNAVVVADSRVVVYDSVAETKKLWIKGNNFSIHNLVMDSQLGAKFADAAVASFRLSPQDYHRYHSPVTGTVKLFRNYVMIETEKFGEVLFVAIGANEVGTVLFHEKWQKPGSKIKKGDELGIFQFGGSSIIVVFEKGRIEFDKDLVDLSRHQIQVSVEVGMSLGQAQMPQ